jgi:hypothetical protein
MSSEMIEKVRFYSDVNSIKRRCSFLLQAQSGFADGWKLATEKTDSIIRANLLKTFSRIAILTNKTNVRFIDAVCLDREPYLQIIPGNDQINFVFYE